MRTVVSLCLLGLLKQVFVGAVAKHTTHTSHLHIPDHRSCCRIVEDHLGSKVLYTDSAAYEASLDSYWSGVAGGLQPKCIVQPTCSQEVATVVSALKDHKQCEFAVRGAGHTTWAGAANIQGGVTIDLRSLNTTSVSDDKKIASIGGGAHWAGVYRYLDDRKLGVVGGRVSTVGVGGLTLGGGISFFSSRFGFVCDNVESFELVMADGSIENISAKNKPDLFRALKGGSNNFGIVTTFRLKTFPSGDLWGGAVYHNISYLEKQSTVFERVTGSKEYDPYAAIIHSVVWTQPGKPLIANTYSYTKQPAKNATSPFLAQMVNFPSIDNTLRVAPITSLTDELGTQSNQTRKMFATISFRNNAKFMLDFFHLFNTTAQQNIFQHAPAGTFMSYSMQPIPQIITSKSQETGGNVLGFTPDDGDVVNILVSCQWDGEEHDELIISEVRKVIEKGQKMAKARDVYVRALYLNYAYRFQDPIGGYGSEEVEFLRNVSRKYDPRGVFQTQMPGGFKLWADHGTG